MKRNTLLISAAGALGLLAVWWFILRKSAATTDATTATTTPATAATLSGTGSSSTTDTLLSTLISLVTPTSTPATTPAATPKVTGWVKTKNEKGNLWTDVKTGFQQWLEKGHNPNLPDTLTIDDLLKLKSPGNEDLGTTYTPAAGAASTSRENNATSTTRTGAIREELRVGNKRAIPAAPPNLVVLKPRPPLIKPRIGGRIGLKR